MSTNKKPMKFINILLILIFIGIYFPAYFYMFLVLSGYTQGGDLIPILFFVTYSSIIWVICKIIVDLYQIYQKHSGHLSKPYAKCLNCGKRIELEKSFCENCN